jgi:hypothetical protein
MDHHVLERPRIPTARRKPSMIKLDLDAALVDGATVENLSNKNNKKDGPKVKGPPVVKAPSVSPVLPATKPSNEKVDENFEAKSNRKWAQILGVPITEEDLVKERKELKRLAKHRGAKTKDIDFILNQTRTASSMEVLHEDRKLPLDSVHRKVLQRARTASKRLVSLTSLKMT